MNSVSPTHNRKTDVIHLTPRNLCLPFVVAIFALTNLACESQGSGTPVCGIVKVAKDCKAKCSRIVDADGTRPKICVTQLISRKNSENSILKNKTKKVNTVKLPREICFEVDGDKPRDPEVVKRLQNACAGQ